MGLHDEYCDDDPSLPRQHVIRPVLPWRPPDVLTECGRKVDDLQHVITRQAYLAKVRKLGTRRAMLTTCLTCSDTAERWSDWATNPADVIRRETGYGRDDTPLRRELLAIAALIEEHRAEFDDYLAGLDQATDLAAVRQARRRRAPVARRR
jgi:hypothetical protein